MKYIENPFWDDAIDAESVAEMLGTSSNNIRSHYKEMGIPFTNIAGRVIYRESEVRDWQRKRVEAKRIDAERAEAQYASMMQRASLGRAA